jgi:hypothetical protein
MHHQDQEEHPKPLTYSGRFLIKYTRGGQEHLAKIRSNSEHQALATFAKTYGDDYDWISPND